MLIQFRVENHRSIRDEHSLSFVSAALGIGNDERLIEHDHVPRPLVPAVAIYGANASGKSNVLNALAFMRDAVVESYRFWEPDSGVPTEAFALSSRRHEPSLYEIDAIVDSVRVRYGFVVTPHRVEEEWVYAWPHGHKQVWFEREADNFEFGRKLQGDNAAIRTLTRDNSLFLSVAAQNNHPTLTPIFRWFRLAQINTRRLMGRAFAFRPAAIIGEAFSRQLSLFGEEDDVARDRQAVLDLLQVADTGIVDIRVDESDPRSASKIRRRHQLQFRHRSEGIEEAEAWLPLEVESAGTVALIELAPRLTRALRVGGLMCIDELEASLHPMLAHRLLSIFQDPEQNSRGAQLLFTTHHTHLLGSLFGESPLRRDQIWFTEKDPTGASHLYPLTDFHPRKQENLERGYLQGRYGAIPFIGELPAPKAETPS